MIVGVPKEIKRDEYRVAMLPFGVEELVRAGHQVVVESGAGLGSGLTDHAYEQAGASLVRRAADVFGSADLIVKVKEPLEPEWPLLRPGQTLFTYLHLAADRKLTESLLASGATCVAYETLRDERGNLPLLKPMSEVAGRMSIQEGAKYLEKPQMGRGILLAGVPGVAPAHIAILGGGVVGANAAKVAAGFKADVAILDVNMERLRYLDDVMPKNVMTQMSTPANIREAVVDADLVIGGVLIVGAKAPKLITRDMLSIMKPGSVIVDVSVDQGGCVETCKPTTHADPTYVVDGVVHYGVANMPGAVPYTSTLGLTGATLPYAVELANKGWKTAIAESRELMLGVNVVAGKIVYEAVAEAFGMPYTSLDSVLG